MGVSWNFWNCTSRNIMDCMTVGWSILCENFDDDKIIGFRSQKNSKHLIATRCASSPPAKTFIV